MVAWHTGPEVQRVFWFLDAVRAVYRGSACFTEAGTAYMGVSFRFTNGEHA